MIKNSCTFHRPITNTTFTMSVSISRCFSIKTTVRHLLAWIQQILSAYVLVNRIVFASKYLQVSDRMLFLLSIWKKVSKQSLFTDDNGIRETSCPRRYYKNGKVGSVAVGNHTDYTHIMQRQYGRHKATYELNGSVFPRIITTVKSRS